MAKTQETGIGYIPSAHVYDFIKEMEGDERHQANSGSFRRGKFYLYNDAASHTTIGYGHKLTREEISSGRYREGLSIDEAHKLLRKDVADAAKVAATHFGKDGWEMMSQAQKDAAIDHAYNLGAAGLRKFPRWSNALRKGDWETVGKESKRFYKDSRSRAYEPLSKRNAAYYAAFVKPNMERKDTQPKDTQKQYLLMAKNEEKNAPEEMKINRQLIRVLAKNTEKNFVRRILDPEDYPKMQLNNGYEATHLMAWGEIGPPNARKYIVFPTVVQKVEGGPLEKLEGHDVWDHAMRNKEYIEFDTPEEAEDFSKNYKEFWEYRKRGLLNRNRR